jgi:hypothetical protein
LIPSARIALKITALANTVPEEAGVLMRRAYALLPHIKITELLLEVDAWTSFSRHFTHLKTGEPVNGNRFDSFTLRGTTKVRAMPFQNRTDFTKSRQKP